MEGLEYLLVEPACEVNEKRTGDKKDGNDNVSLNDNEKIEVYSAERSFAEKDWNDPGQNEVQNGRNQTNKKKPEEVGVRKQA